MCLHAARITALREFWTDWLPTETRFLLQKRRAQANRLRYGAGPVQRAAELRDTVWCGIFSGKTTKQWESHLLIKEH